MNYSNFLCAVLLLFLVSCGNSKKTVKEQTDFNPKELHYAKEFEVAQSPSATRLTIYSDETHSPQSTDEFILTNSKKFKIAGATTIPVPCKKIICLSSTQLAYFFELDDISHIVAINSSRYLFNEKMKEKLTSGKVKHVGKEGNFNIEIIAALDPDVIFVSPFKAGGYDGLRNLGIPLVPMAAYNEKTPLGRAEWIKMIALFLKKESHADSLFNGIENRYLNLKKLASEVKKRPTVFSGKMRNGSWYVPGGNSFYAHYFRDAGADYVIKDDEQGAYPLDFESIYLKAANADFWRIVHPEKTGLTQKEFLEQDERYRDFKAFNEGNILLCNLREKPYREQSPVKPDVLLADYIYFFHPELIPNYNPYFFERLK